MEVHSIFSEKKSFVWLDEYPLVFSKKKKVHVLRLLHTGSIKLPQVSGSFVLQWRLITCRKCLLYHTLFNHAHYPLIIYD